jgi:hypothetical protein
VDEFDKTFMKVTIEGRDRTAGALKLF